MKGTSLINNLAGILLRFREDYIGMAGDIQKMYHAIRISELDIDFYGGTLEYTKSQIPMSLTGSALAIVQQVQLP